MNDQPATARPAPDAGPPGPAVEPVLQPSVGPATRRKIVGALAAGGAIVGLGLVAAGLVRLPVEPSPASGTALLAVVGVDGSLTTVDPDDGTLAALGIAGEQFQFPAWSPDGGQIAVTARRDRDFVLEVFERREPDTPRDERPSPGGSKDTAANAMAAIGATGIGRRAAAVDVPGTILYASPDRAPFYVSWSPDGASLTFLTTEPDGLALRVVPADGSEPAAVLRTGSPMYWDWVNPERIFVHAGLGEGSFLGELRLDGASIGAGEDRPGLFRSPVVAAGGSHRAWIEAGADADGRVMIESRPADGVASSPGDGAWPALEVFGPAALGFNATADTLAVLGATSRPATPRTLPFGTLTLVDVASGEARPLPGDDIAAFLRSPNGATLAILHLRGGGFATGGVALRLSFVSAATGETVGERPIVLSDAFAGRWLPFFDQYALSHRLWSPDDASIALPLETPGGSNQLSVIRVDGSEPTVVSEGVMGFWTP